ncbi:unnamed protein product [Mytilus edulis]|uniref:Uncharacterized protein n=1 Tax=Mytilus edulis TaxID=6550 RepID=A0A8S3QER9_MYTED|nr:unnamed protein product [Mytilus edulis]
MFKVTKKKSRNNDAVAKHKARLKSKELVQPSSNITPNRTQGKTTYTKYTLNTTKAAQKMVDATEQMDVQAEFKRRTLVMKFTPAAFLMFHKHTLSFYENSTKLTAISHFKRDKNNLVVEESLSIKPITTTGIGRRQLRSHHMILDDARYPENITPSSQTRLDQADTTNKHTKQAAPKKQKNVKQEDLKSKLAVAEAHIAALENTVLDNNNTIRNLKLAQLGHNDSSQNRVDYLSSNPNVLTTNSTIQNCHCTQLDNRVKELEREMTNLRLINLENQMLTLRNQSQNNFHTQGPVHMVPPQPIFHATQTATPNQWMQQVQPHPFFQHGVPAPPPYMYRQSDKIPEASRQVQRPNINQQVQQAQMFNPLPSEFQLPTTDSNNCIAVDQSSSQHILFNQSYRNQGKGNGESNMKLAQRLNTNQQAQPARTFNPLSRELVTRLQNSDSNNCIAVDQTLSQQILFNQSHESRKRQW